MANNYFFLSIPFSVFLLRLPKELSSDVCFCFFPPIDYCCPIYTYVAQYLLALPRQSRNFTGLSKCAQHAIKLMCRAPQRSAWRRRPNRLHYRVSTYKQERIALRRSRRSVRPPRKQPEPLPNKRDRRWPPCDVIPID